MVERLGADHSLSEVGMPLVEVPLERDLGGTEATITPATAGSRNVLVPPTRSQLWDARQGHRPLPASGHRRDGDLEVKLSPVRSRT
jgi:hypothetical protein